MSFPTNLDNFTPKSDNVDNVVAQDVNELQTAVESLEAKVGIDGSAEATSLDKKVATLITNNTNTNTGDETATSLGSKINAATEKATPIDTDMVGLMDSAASNILKKLSWSNIKATLKTYFDTVYTLALLGGVPTSRTINAQALSSNITLTQDNVGDGTNNKQYSATEKSKLAGISGTNTGDETAPRIATIITGAGAQTTPLDADEFPFYKIVGTVLSKVTWANIKATLKTYFDTLYTLANLGGVPTSRSVNAKALSANITLNQDDVGDGTTNKAYTATEKTKLSGIAANANNYVHPNHSGDVTSVADGAQTIANNAVTNAKAADMAQNTIKGRITTATGDPEDLTAANVKTILALVKSDVGLGNVDNTSDVNKPVSTAQQTALDLKAPLRPVTAKTSLVDADEVTGNDSAASFSQIRTTWTNIKAFLKTYFDSLYTLANLGGVPTTRTVNGHALSADVSVTKSDVGLGNVTDDAQIAKSIVTAKGDIIAASGNATPVKLAVGTDAQVLTADSASAGGVKWADPVSGVPTVLTLMPKPNYIENSNAPAALLAYGSNTVLKITQVVIPFKITVNKLSFYLGNSNTASGIKFCLYSEDGQTQVLTATANSLTNSSVNTITLGSPVTLEPGVYYLAALQVGAGAINIQGFSISSTPSSLLTLSGEPVVQANLTVTADTLPATITPSTLTESTSGSPVIRLDN